MKNLLFVLFVLLISSNVIFSQSETPDPNFWIADGPFKDVISISVTVKGEYTNHTYLGGRFTYMGKRTGHGIKMTTSSSVIDYDNAKVNDLISSVVSDGAGGWYIGGGFTKIDGIPRNRLARIKADGSLDMDWIPDANNIVECLFFDGNHVYVGGQFNNLGNKIARLDKTYGIVDPLWSASAGGTVYSLYVDNTGVFLGGVFNFVNWVKRNRIAKLNKTNGALEDWNPNANNTVETISASLNASGNATAIYAGGAFTSIGGVPKSRIAKLLNNNAGDVDGSWTADANGTVYVVKVDQSNNNIYAGGHFTTIGGEPISRIAKLDETDGTPDLNFNPGADNLVRDLVIHGSDLYVAGDFLTIDDAERNYLAKLNKSNGNVDDNWIAGVGNNAYSIGISGILGIYNVYAGGIFVAGGKTGEDGARRNGLARLKNSDGTLDMGWDPHPNRSVIYTLEINGEYLYIGGYFDTISSLPLRNLVRLNLSDNSVDAGWTPNPNDPVTDIIFNSDGDIIVAGYFTIIGEESRSKLAKLNNTNGNPYAWNPAPNQVVNCIAIDKFDYIYAGGDFSFIGGESRNRIAKLKNSDGLAESWVANANNTVITIAVFGGHVYAGGTFTNIGGQSISRIAKLDVITGDADEDWNPNPNWTVDYIKPHGDKLYVGGSFTIINGISQFGIARLDLETGIPDSWYPGLIGGGVDEIEFNRRGDLIIMGEFNLVGGTYLYPEPAVFRNEDFYEVQLINIESLSEYTPITIEVRSSSSPYSLVSSASSIGGGGLEIPTYLPNLTDNTPYYIVVKSVNTIETWSNPVSFTDGILEYDFTSAITQAYGSNMILKDGLWSFYTGDPNQDGTVDLGDMSLIHNDAIYYVSGNVPADLNGDEFVDIIDVLFAYNNSNNFISSKKP